MFSQVTGLIRSDQELLFPRIAYLSDRVAVRRQPCIVCATLCAADIIDE